MSKQTGRQPGKQTRVERRREEQRQRAAEQAQAAKNKRITMLVSIIVTVLLLAGIGSVVFFVSRSSAAQGQTTNGTSGDAAVPAYQPINGVSCDSAEHATPGDYHIHAHISIYINGQPAQVPQNLGIAADQSCIYWLHTHDTTGVIHIESPNKNIYMLGTFFDIWEFRFPQLPFPSQLSASTGWQVYVNGQPYTGDFRQIPLEAHTLITMAYNTPGVTPDTDYSWNGL